jgi:carboxypeptidase family protein/TonB-dependent receptor-like protein
LNCISPRWPLDGQRHRFFPAATFHKKLIALDRDGEKMLKRLSIYTFFILGIVLLFTAGPTKAQLGNAGSIEGVVKDPSGAAVANATVEISYSVSGFQRQATTGPDGSFRFTNVPFNSYHMVVTAAGFANYTQDVDVRSSVPTAAQISLKLGTAATSITVEATGADLIETESSFHTDVDRGLFERLPLESQSSSVSALVTQASPGVVADSNGLFHGLGDHAENSFSVDGQPITDQQSKVFSNQIPVESIQSMEVISGGPPAEFGDKTSLVIKVTTRSGLGQTKPVGTVKASYGSFGSVSGGFDVAFGGQKWGNFISASGLNTSRFLDPPELHAIHDKGNEENLFDRVDYQITGADSIHANFGYTRSWFQTPNTIDNLNSGVTNPLNPNQLVGPADQRALIKTFNIAPVWTRLISPTTLFTLGGYVRQDQFGYFPSGNVFADGTGLIPGGSSATLSQQRKLTNAGIRSDVSYVKGIHNIKAGVTFQHTFLTENFNFGITDPAFNDPASPTFIPILAPFDLTRGGSLFLFHGHTDVKQFSVYLQDMITKGNWSFNLGIRGDVYRGIVHDWQPQPRVGLAYNIKKTNSVLRLSYSRVLETPFNENLILASLGAANPVITDVIGGASLQAPIRSGQRNQFNAGFQQAFGKFLVVDADYLWKYTHNAYDFSTFGNTPIFFPIAWKSSKIDGPSVRVSLPNYHGLTAFAVLAHVRARYFPPQIGGLGSTVTGGEVFRIDHDQAFNQTTHLQYQPWKTSPWIGFNWRYDSGLVASNPNLTDFPTALGFLDADQQAAIGLFCGSDFATPTNRLTPASCMNQTNVGATRIHLAGATFDLDRNPTRVTPRNLLDASVGDDDLFHGDRYKWSLRFTVINMTNKTALFNFLSTFSGTHFVTPRAYTAELGFHF